MNKQLLSSLRLSSSAAALVLAATVPNAAQAQDTPAEEADELIAEPDAVEEEPADQIIVTGSLIQRPNNTAVSPIIDTSIPYAEPTPTG